MGGQLRIGSTEWMIHQIKQMIHVHLNKVWMADEWRKRESGAPIAEIHPLVRVAFDAHQQIEGFIASGAKAVTKEIWEITELAIKINSLTQARTNGLQERLDRLTSSDFSLYSPTRYEIQLAGMLLARGYNVEFPIEGKTRTPDLIARCEEGECEVECKHKLPNEDNLDFVRSIYNSTQTARKQFSKNRVGLIFIDINQPNFSQFESEHARLEQEIRRAMRNSSSISGIFLTSKITLQEDADFVYRHRVRGHANSFARHPIPGWLASNIVN